MIGPIAFGSISRKMMRRFLAPEARAASTNSFSFIDRKTPRMIRASYIQKVIASTITMSSTLPPRIVEAMISTTSDGIDRNRSVSRIRKLSSLPP